MSYMSYDFYLKKIYLGVKKGSGFRNDIWVTIGVFLFIFTAYV